MWRPALWKKRLPAQGLTMHRGDPFDPTVSLFLSHSQRLEQTSSCWEENARNQTPEVKSSKQFTSDKDSLKVVYEQGLEFEGNELLAGPVHVS